MDVDYGVSIAPQQRQCGAAAPPKRSRKKMLAPIDGRTIVAKRIAELKHLFTAELTAAGAVLTPMQLMNIDLAVQAVVVAERGRGRYLNEGKGDLSDLVAAEGAPIWRSSGCRCRARRQSPRRWSSMRQAAGTPSLRR